LLVIALKHLEDKHARLRLQELLSEINCGLDKILKGKKKKGIKKKNWRMTAKAAAYRMLCLIDNEITGKRGGHVAEA